MAFISLGKVDKNIISIFIGSIICFINRIFFKIDTQLFKQKIIPNFLASFCRIFTFIPKLIIEFRTKNIHDDKDQNIISINTLKSEYKKRKEDITKGTWIYILLSAFLVFIQGILVIYTLQIEINLWIWDIFITCFFYYLIFKIKLYKHHYLSMILIILIGLFIDLFLENLQNDFENNFLFLLLAFLREIIYSLNDVIYKYIMEKKYCSVYDLSLYIGAFDVILFGLFGLMNHFFLKIDDFEKYFSNFDGAELLVCLGFIIIQFIFNLSLLITIKNYTPCHVFIIYVFGQFAYYIDFSIDSIILMICIVFILFFSLVFNEIIEINICRLSYNTKKNITNRAESEDISLEGNLSRHSIDENYRIYFNSIELEEKDDLSSDL